MKKKTVIIGSALAAVLVLGGTGAAVAANHSNDDDTPLAGTTLDMASKAALAETGEGRVTEAEAEHGGYEVEVTLDNGSEVDVWLDDTFTVVRVDAADDKGTDDNSGDDSSDDNSDDNSSTGSDDNSTLTADERASAEAAALAAEPGKVTQVERSDDGDHAFEVEITREDGTEIEVELDAAFTVVRVDDHADSGHKGNDDK
ncbi:MAG: PepSY domain-containing protein [Mycetocola sp.]